VASAGTVVETHVDGRIVLRCSDGFDPPVFDDLVVEMTIDAGQAVRVAMTIGRGAATLG